MRARSLVAIASMALPAVLSAQTPSSDSLFAHSPWGAEAAVGGTGAVSLLHGSPNGGAWVFSLAANVQHLDSKITPIFGTPQEAKATGGQVALQIGRRSYRGAGALRPFVGAGIAGTYGGLGATHMYGAGVYGELGASYFVVPHLSVGVAEMLNFNYSHAWADVTTNNSWILSLPAPTARVTIFF